MITLVFNSRADFPLPASRVLISHRFTAEEAALLHLAGADVRAGGLDGPIFGSNTAP